MEIKVYESEYGKIRVVLDGDNTWFVGKDVTESLGYVNASKALTDHVDDDDKVNNESLFNIGQRGGWLINESGLYSLILSSQLPTAKKFKRWVTSEVLPSIRKNGAYIDGQDAMSSEELIAKALIAAQSVIRDREERAKMLAQKITEDAPHATLGKAISESVGSVSIGTLADILWQNGYKLGRNKLFAWMRDEGYLNNHKNSWNLPTRKSLGLELMEVREYTYDGYGRYNCGRVTMITPKGQLYFVNKFAKNEVIA